MSLQFFSFDKDDAIKYGTEEAVLLYHFKYWIRVNKSNNCHFHDGKYWCYNSYKSLTELFPFWNEQKCKRLVKSLKKQNVILVGNYNKSPFDNTNWYTLNSTESLNEQQQLPRSKETDLVGQKQPTWSVKSNRPIPNTTNTLPIISSKAEAFETRSEGKEFCNSGEEANLKKKKKTEEEVLARLNKPCPRVDDLCFDDLFNRKAI